MENIFHSSALFSDGLEDKLLRIKDILKANEISKKKKKPIVLITDFDHTLTTMTSKQCHDIVGENEIYTEEFRQEFRSLCGPPPEGISVGEWWRLSHYKIVEKSGLTERIFLECTEHDRAAIYLRQGVVDLLKRMRECNIPTVISSAGIHNVICRVLDNHGFSDHAHDEYFHIDANILEFSSDSGELLRITPDIPLHPALKTELMDRSAHMFPLNIANRSFDDEQQGLVLSPSQAIDAARLQQVAGSEPSTPTSPSKILPFVAIVLGDRTTDFQVVTKKEETGECVALRIGFAPNAVKGRPLIDSGVCDIVLPGEEHPVYPVLRYIESLLELSEEELDRDLHQQPTPDVNSPDLASPGVLSPPGEMLLSPSGRMHLAAAHRHSILSNDGSSLLTVSLDEEDGPELIR